MASPKIGIKTRGDGKKLSMISTVALNEMLEKTTTRGRDKRLISNELIKRKA